MFFPVDSALPGISNPIFCILYVYPDTHHRKNPGDRSPNSGADCPLAVGEGMHGPPLVTHLIQLDPVEGLQWVGRLGDTLLPE